MVWVTITNIGQSVFPSPFESSKIFTLKYLLHVPSITKNPLCVSKFVLDNNVFFEFHSHFCFVKDQISKKLLLEGKLRNGLYIFDTTQLNLSKQLQTLPSSLSSSLFSLYHLFSLVLSIQILVMFLSRFVIHCITFGIIGYDIPLRGLSKRFSQIVIFQILIKILLSFAQFDVLEICISLHSLYLKPNTQNHCNLFIQISGVLLQ